MNVHECIASIIPFTQPLNKQGQAFAPSNIALSKYWGKRCNEFNLPTNGSLSISLGHLGSDTTIELAESDSVSLNGQQLEPSHKFAQRLWAYIDLLLGVERVKLNIKTVNSIPTAAGLASSASGFAALTLALNNLFGWQLNPTQLSILARIGSGSACRSIYSGFVNWNPGEQADGMDSYAEPIESDWSDFRIGLLKLTEVEKTVNSRQGMNQTTASSDLYPQWPEHAEKSRATILEAIQNQDFETLGQTAEKNALTMHATMISAWPPLLYWQASSVETLHKVWALRNEGLPVYLTMDAGPNVKLLFEKASEHDIQKAFETIEIISPLEGVKQA